MTKIPGQRHRERLLAKAMADMYRKAIGSPTADVEYTDRWHYENHGCAVFEGLPQPFKTCTPSRIRGGRRSTILMLKMIAKGEITLRILSPEAFCLRRQQAIDDGTYVPVARKARKDISHPHFRRKKYLYDPVPPNTTAVVEDAMETGEYEYPPVEREKRVSNVVKRTRAEKEAAKAARVQVRRSPRIRNSRS